MDTKQYKELSNKLDVIIKLLALSVVGEGTQKDQVGRLLSIGLMPSQVADVLGKSINLVTAYSSQIKKQSSERRDYGRQK